MVAACAPDALDGWTIDGNAPPGFVDEVRAAAARTADVVGLDDRSTWYGIVHVVPGPYPCGMERPCSGEIVGPFDVVVAYSEAHGLGPDLGTTALEHELCHAALMRVGVSTYDEAAANACAAQVVAAMSGAVP